MLNNNKLELLIADVFNPLLNKEIIVHLASKKTPIYGNALRTLEGNYIMLKNITDKCIKDSIMIAFVYISVVYGVNLKTPFKEELGLVLFKYL